MDKIVATDWSKTFSSINQTVVQASDRYTEVVVISKEPGLASINSRHIQLPFMEVTFVSVQPEQKLIMVDVQDSEYVESAFILNGAADSVFSNKPVEARPNSHTFQYSPFIDATHKILSKNLEALHVHYHTTYFKDLLTTSNTKLFDKLASSIDRKENFLVPSKDLPMQAKMNNIINSIQQCQFQSLARALFIEAKMLELFSLQLDHMMQLQNEKPACSNTDKEKLLAVKEFIEANYLSLLSLQQLSRMFGLNEFKLKKGFKLLFNTTVFGYIQDLRMQHAVTLLHDKQMTVTEVALTLGYSSSSNFSAEYKKKFGHPPTKPYKR